MYWVFCKRRRQHREFNGDVCLPPSYAWIFTSFVLHNYVVAVWRNHIYAYGKKSAQEHATGLSARCKFGSPKQRYCMYKSNFIIEAEMIELADGHCRCPCTYEWWWDVGVCNGRDMPLTTDVDYQHIYNGHWNDSHDKHKIIKMNTL